ncbi:MAG: hypothetical protein QM485_01880 [Flavobacteriaceae bacterium]
MRNIVFFKWQTFEKYLSDFWNENQIDSPEKWKKLVPRILVIVGGFFILNKIIIRMVTMPFEVYYNDFLFFEFLKKCIPTYYLWVIVFLLLVFFCKKIFIPWASLQEGKTVRNFVLFVCAILVWKHSTHDYNLLFDQGYYADRILLVLSLILVYWRPAFTILFLCILFPLVGQLEVIEVFARSTTFLLSRVIILFITFFLINLFSKGFRFTDFVFMLGCLVAANYFVSGSGKIMLVEWIFNDQANNLIATTYANGWHSHLSSKSISELVRFMGMFNVPIRLFSVTVECGFAFMFFHIKWARLLLFGAIIMHLGIIFYSGIFFWMWMLLIVAMLFIFRKKRFEEILIFNKRYFLVALVIIISGRYWVGPSPKVWFDSPVNYTYKFEAEMENGSKQMLPPDYFSPYDVQFTFGSFKYLNDNDPLLEVLWGASGSRSLHAYFQKSMKTSEEIFEYEEKYGRIYTNKSSKDLFKKFIKDYVTNWNSGKGDKSLPSFLTAPRLLLTYPKWPDGPNEQKIIKVNVHEVTTYYSDETGYTEIRNRKLLSIPILKGD